MHNKVSSRKLCVLFSTKTVFNVLLQNIYTVQFAVQYLQLLCSTRLERCYAKDKPSLAGLLTS